ncbi:hypothetical protein GCM10023157_28920 [Gluconacetobacter asukensis]
MRHLTLHGLEQMAGLAPGGIVIQRRQWRNIKGRTGLIGRRPHRRWRRHHGLRKQRHRIGPSGIGYRQKEKERQSTGSHPRNRRRKNCPHAPLSATATDPNRHRSRRKGHPAVPSRR